MATPTKGHPSYHSCQMFIWPLQTKATPLIIHVDVYMATPTKGHPSYQSCQMFIWPLPTKTTPSYHVISDLLSYM